MKRSFVLLCIAASTFFIACKKTVTELPPATQTGAHTFGAKVDGNLWVPAGFGVIPTADILEAHFLPNWDLFINARNFSSSPTETEFELFVKGVTAPGVYQLNTTLPAPNTSASYGYYVHRQMTPTNEWMTSTQYTGTVTITKIDTVNWFVSGLFEFRAINLYNSPQPLTVTEGRFDVKLQ